MSLQRLYNSSLLQNFLSKTDARFDNIVTAVLIPNSNNWLLSARHRWYRSLQGQENHFGNSQLRPCLRHLLATQCMPNRDKLQNLRQNHAVYFRILRQYLVV